MRITCEREKLLHCFTTAAAVVPSRSPKPILTCVKLEVSPERATAMATDLEVGIRVDVPGIQVDVPGSVVLPVGRFGSILRESTDATLHLETDGQSIQVRGARSEFRLPYTNPDEFPSVSRFDEDRYLEIPARLLRELIRRTVFATDNESSRYALGGVLLEVQGEQITAVGTDGRRLAVMEGACRAHGGYTSPDTMTIVPTRAMQLIERTISDAGSEAQFVARLNDILVRSERATIYSRLVEGRFPKWRDVFPKRDGVQRISMVAGPAHAAVRQAAIVTSEESRGVDFTFADGKLLLAARAAESGQSRVELPIAYEGPEVSIMLDPRYVGDFLRVLDPEKTFTVEIKDAESAAILSTDDGYGYVIMPLARDR